jgi:hypothetical protein
MKYFFILGCPRSGTTMLQQALNRHSSIAIPPETKYFSAFLGHSRTCQERHLRQLNADLRTNLSMPVCPIHSKKQARRFYEQLASSFLEATQRGPVVYLGDKSPAHSGFLPRIKQVFPEAKYLWLFRDGRDVALSLTKVPWMCSNIYATFLIWLFYYRKQMLAENDRDLDILFVRYEDLVANPVVELQRVTAFLDLVFEQAMVVGCPDRASVPPREYAWKARSLEPINSNSVGLWRNSLSSQDVAVLERLGGRALKGLGYELADRPLETVSFRQVLKLISGTISLAFHVPLELSTNQFFRRPLCKWCLSNGV